jgi:hypothetical protein
MKEKQIVGNIARMVGDTRSGKVGFGAVAIALGCAQAMVK